MVPLLRRSIPLLLILAACGGAASAAEITTAPASPSTTLGTTTTVSELAASYPTEIEEVADTRPVPQALSTATISDGQSLVAKIKGEIDVYESPDAPAPLQTLPARTILGTSTVLAVVEGPVAGWAKVLLPTRPNDSTGWIDASEVDMFVVEGRLVVDLSDRTLTYYEGDRLILETPVAVGTSRNPTPAGTFFVTDSVTLADADSPWGPHALGLSARSETITEYNGGDGIIGIHGTNRPGSIGQAASLGCVRVPNDVITRLHELVAIGTPVEIIA